MRISDWSSDVCSSDLTNAARVEHRGELACLLSPAIRARKSAELLDRLAEQGVPAGPINDLKQVFADPQVAFRGLQIVAGEDGLPGVASPVVLDGIRKVAGAPRPRVGMDAGGWLGEPRPYQENYLGFWNRDRALSC